MKQISDLMAEYDRLASGLCLSARADKVLPKSEAERVLELIGQIREVYATEDSIPKDHVWRLTYIFPQLLSEADHCRDVEKKKALELYAWNFQYHVSKIFEPAGRASVY